MFIGDNLHRSFDFSKEIFSINQNSPKSDFIYFGRFNYLVYYNLIVCYSLDPV